MKIKIYVLIIITFLLNTSIQGQEIEKSKLKRSSLYFELNGISGTILSLNYDYIIKESYNRFIDISFGYGYLPATNGFNPIYGIPISINFNKGYNYHYFETGIGLTYNSGLVQTQWGFGLDTEATSDIGLYSSFRIGYRYQKPDGDLFLRASFNPLIRLILFDGFGDKVIFPRFGLTIGFIL